MTEGTSSCARNGHTDSRNIVSSVGTGAVFRAAFVAQNPALVVGAAYGMIFLLKHRRWTSGAIPVLFLIAACGFALLQKPWWKFYLIHINIPLAMLAAFGLDALIRPDRAHQPASYSFQSVHEAVLLFMLCSWCGFVLPTYLKTVEAGLYAKHELEDQAVVRVAKAFHERKGIELCYSADPGLVFASGMLVPPSLAVLSLKRMMVTGLNDKGIAEEARCLDLPMVMLRSDGEADRTEWLSWLTNDYEFVVQGSGNELWVKRGLRLDRAGQHTGEHRDARLTFIDF